jgi:lia operon protein LiaF
MRLSFNNILPLIIILIGIGYLLANLGIIAITPWQALVRFWPALLVLWGLRMVIWDVLFSRFRHYKTSSLVFGSVLILVGLNLLLPRLGFISFTITWSIVWPILLIALGLQLLTSERRKGKNAVLIGSFSRGGDSWYVEDLYLNRFIGDIRLDLTKAVIPNKEIFFDIHGSIGDITIYVPNDLPLKVKSSVGVGEIRVLDRRGEGIARVVELITPDYDSTERKLNLQISLKIGDINVRRIE